MYYIVNGLYHQLVLISPLEKLSLKADIWDIARSVLIIGQTKDGKHYLSQEARTKSKRQVCVPVFFVLLFFFIW